MRAAKLSNERLAAAVGVHPKSVSRWLSDRVTPEQDTISGIARALGADAVWLQTGRGARSDRQVRERGERYGVPDAEMRGAIDAGALLRMPPRYYDVAYELLDAMAEAGLGRDAQDAAEAWLTQLACGVLTPGFPLAAAELEADARDAVAFLRRVYARRGLTIGAASPLALTEDPDSVSGRELERQMAAKRSGKKAG